MLRDLLLTSGLLAIAVSLFVVVRAWHASGVRRRRLVAAYDEAEFDTTLRGPGGGGRALFPRSGESQATTTRGMPLDTPGGAGGSSVCACMRGAPREGETESEHEGEL